MDGITQALLALAPLVALLMANGFIIKYVPVDWIAKIPNVLIPFLNAVITFLTAFGPAPAQAGVFGAIADGLSLPAKAVVSVFVSSMASVLYETYARPWLERKGIEAARPSTASKRK